MAWYKNGSVTINTGDTYVTGTNTRFASNTRVGDAIRAPDGEWYELINTSSETVIGIYPPYRGVSVVGSADYMIAPIQGYNKETADRLRAITDSIRDFSSEIDAAREAADRSKASADEAKISEDASKLSETNSKVSETNSKTSEDNAKASELAAKASEDNAATSETNSKDSEVQAKTSEDNAKASELAAKDSEIASKNSQDSARASELAAKASQDAAKLSETNSKNSETNAGQSASSASSDSLVAVESKDAAQLALVRAEKARDDAIAAAATVTGNILDMGSWDASSNIYPEKPAVTAFWKVVGNGSGTDNGVTVEYGIGDTLIWSKPIEEFYKIDNTESVSSVNGHTGVVIINKFDVGLSNVDNTSDLNKPITNAQAAVNALKFDKSDVINNVTTNDDTKALSATQGKYLNELIQSSNGDRYTKSESDSRYYNKSFIDTTFIDNTSDIIGLIPTWVSGSELSMSPGSAKLPDGSILKLNTTTALTGLGPGVGWYYVYIYKNGSVISFEVSATAPSAPYMGYARTKSGDPSRRFLIALNCRSGGSFRPFLWYPDYVMYNDNAALYVSLTGAVNQAQTAFSVANAVPPTTRRHKFEVYSAVGGTMAIGAGNTQLISASSASRFMGDTFCDSSQNMWYSHNTAVTGGTTYDVRGFGSER